MAISHVMTHREQSARESAQRQADHPIPITYTRAVTIPKLRELVFEWEAVRHNIPITRAKRLHLENCTDGMCVYVATLIARGYDVGWDSAGGR